MIDENMFEVDFYEYCEICKYCSLKENEHPCKECLESPYNYGATKPILFEENK